MSELRWPVKPMQIHLYCDKCAVFLEPEEGQQKHPMLTYLNRSAFDVVDGYIVTNESFVSFTLKELMGMVGTFENLHLLKIHLEDIAEKSMATAKFFGEMLPTGNQGIYIDRASMRQMPLFNYKCTNPKCGHEVDIPAPHGKPYPYIDTVEARDPVLDPRQIITPEDEIDRRLKNHVGSTVMGNANIQKGSEKLPAELFGVKQTDLVDNQVNPEAESGKVEDLK